MQLRPPSRLFGATGRWPSREPDLETCRESGRQSGPSPRLAARAPAAEQTTSTVDGRRKGLIRVTRLAHSFFVGLVGLSSLVSLAHCVPPAETVPGDDAVYGSLKLRFVPAASMALGDAVDSFDDGWTVRFHRVRVPEGYAWLLPQTSTNPNEPGLNQGRGGLVSFLCAGSWGEVDPVQNVPLELTPLNCLTPARYFLFVEYNVDDALVLEGLATKATRTVGFSWRFRSGFRGACPLEIRGNERLAVDIPLEPERIFSESLRAETGGLRFDPVANADGADGSKPDGVISNEELRSIQVTVVDGKATEFRPWPSTERDSSTLRFETFLQRTAAKMLVGCEPAPSSRDGSDTRTRLPPELDGSDPNGPSDTSTEPTTTSGSMGSPEFQKRGAREMPGAESTEGALDFPRQRK